MGFSICSLSIRSTFFFIAECHHQELAAPMFTRSRSTTGLVIKTLKILNSNFRIPNLLASRQEAFTGITLMHLETEAAELPL